MTDGTVTIVISKHPEFGYQAKFGENTIARGSDMPAALNAMAYEFQVSGWNRFEDFMMACEPQEVQP